MCSHRHIEWRGWHMHPVTRYHSINRKRTGIMGEVWCIMSNHTTVLCSPSAHTNTWKHTHGRTRLDTHTHKHTHKPPQAHTITQTHTSTNTSWSMLINPALTENTHTISTRTILSITYNRKYFKKWFTVFISCIFTDQKSLPSPLSPFPSLYLSLFLSVSVSLIRVPECSSTQAGWWVSEPQLETSRMGNHLSSFKIIFAPSPGSDTAWSSTF